MDIEEIRESMRARLLAAFADYHRQTNGAYSAVGVVNTNGYKAVAAAMKGKETRAKGSSKILCSDDVFEHNRLLRRVNDLPILLKFWVLYRYTEQFSPRIKAELIEIGLGECGLLSGQMRVVTKLEKIGDRLIMNRREFASLSASDLAKVAGVHPSVYARTYQEKADMFTEYFDELDNQALDILLTPETLIA